MGICVRNKRIMNLKLALLVVVLLPTAVFIRLKLYHRISSTLDILLLPVKRTKLTSFKVNRWRHCPSTSASKSSIRRFVIMEKAPTTAFTFKTLLRHYAKQALTPRSLNMKLGLRCNYHKGRAAIRHYANQTACPLWPLRRRTNFMLRDRGVNTPPHPWLRTFGWTFLKH